MLTLDNPCGVSLTLFSPCFLICRMVKAGSLDKHGRKIEGVTPAAWDKSYVDYSATGEEVRGELVGVSFFFFFFLLSLSDAKRVFERIERRRKN